MRYAMLPPCASSKAAAATPAAAWPSCPSRGVVVQHPLQHQHVCEQHQTRSNAVCRASPFGAAESEQQIAGSWSKELNARQSRRFSSTSVSAAAFSSPSAASSSPSDRDGLASVPSIANGKLISKTEVAAFIQRDDLMDQMYRWAIIEAGEGGVRNFGLPMNVEPFYLPTSTDDARPVLWGFKLGIFKEGSLVCDMGIMFDQEEVSKHEWVGRGDDGFPVLEGKVDQVRGKHFEIWKLCTRPVDDQLRTAIRSFCTGLVTALNRYYAFGSVFVDDAQ